MPRPDTNEFVNEPSVAKREVEVAFVDVLFNAVKFWRVLEPVTRRLARLPSPLMKVLPKVAKVPKRFVEDAVVAKKLVVVALVLVEFNAVKFWRVEEPSERSVPKLPKPVK